MTVTLENLLSAPLPEVPDHGFSAKVMARIDAEQQRDTLLRTIGMGVASAVVIPFLPIRQIVEALIPPLTGQTTLLGVGIAGATLVLSMLLAREIEQD